MASALEIANQALLRVGAEQISAGEYTTPTLPRSEVVVASWPFVRRSVLREHPWNVVTTRTTLLAQSKNADALVPEWDYTGVYKLPVNCLRVLEVDKMLPSQWRVERAGIETDSTMSYTSAYPAVNSGNVYVVSNSGDHGFTTGDRVYISDATHSSIVDDIMPIVVTNTTSFYFPEVDDTGFTDGSTAGGTVTKVTLSPAIVAETTDNLKIRYIEDVTDPSEFDPMLTEALVLRLAVEIVEAVTDSTSKRDLLMAEYQKYLAQVKHIEGQEQSAVEFVESTWLTARY